MRHPSLSAAAPGPARAVPRRGRAAPAAGGAPPLVAVAHGSADPRAAATVDALLRIVRRRADGAGYARLDVRAAYLGHATPTLRRALTALDGPAVVLPLLLTAAYHSKADIPGVLREARTALPGIGVTYGHPLGPHPLLLRVLERRLAEAAGGDLEPRQTAVVLAAAGSSDPGANAVIAGLAARWRAARGWRAVLPAYASAASPTPPEAVAAALRDGARRVFVASYLLAPGRFADQIRRDCLAAGAAVVSAALGAAPEIADVVLERYAEALADGGAAAAV